MNITHHYYSNIDEWLSEYPRFRAVIIDARRANVFMEHPPPREDTNEWMNLISTLDDVFEKLTGKPPSPNSSDFPQEPPF